MPRSILLFENAIKSHVTKKSYMYCLNQFLAFTKMKADDLLALEDKPLQVLLEDYVLYLKEKISPNSIKAKLAPVELFLSMNDRNPNVKKLHKMVPETKKRSGSEIWATKDIQKMLTFSDEKRSRAIIHFLASTGVRIGAIHELKVGNVSEMPENCKCVKIYEGSKEEYLAFLTPEASESLDQYLNERRSDGDKLDSNSPLFRAKYLIGSVKAKPMSYSSCIELVKRVVRNAGLVRQKNGPRYSIQLNHGFRKRYNTILKDNKDVNVNTAEKLMGHKNGLDGVYYNPTPEKRFEELKKAIPELTISDEIRQTIKIKQQEEKIARLESEKKKIMHLEEGVNIVGALFAEQRAKSELLKQLEHPTHHHTKEQDLNLEKFVKSPPNPEIWKAFMEWSQRGPKVYNSN